MNARSKNKKSKISPSKRFFVVWWYKLSQTNKNALRTAKKWQKLNNMASIYLVGIIESIKYLPNNGGCLVFLSEYKRGYKRASDGVRIDDKYLSWKCIFKQGLVKYINNHFGNGMIVEIKGEVLPYAVEHENIVDGYSVIGQTLNMFSVPRTQLRQEQRMIKESQLHSQEIPDMETFNQPDF